MTQMELSDKRNPTIRVEKTNRRLKKHEAKAYSSGL